MYFTPKIRRLDNKKVIQGFLSMICKLKTYLQTNKRLGAREINLTMNFKV